MSIGKRYFPSIFFQFFSKNAHTGGFFHLWFHLFPFIVRIILILVLIFQKGKSGEKPPDGWAKRGGKLFPKPVENSVETGENSVLPSFFLLFPTFSDFFGRFLKKYFSTPVENSVEKCGEGKKEKSEWK